MHDAAEDDQPDGASPGTPWERELQARSSWVSADERDARSDAADQRAEDRDAAARVRDDTADRLVGDARAREELAYARIRQMTQRLNALDAGALDQHLHLQQAVEAIQEALDSGGDEPLAQLLRQVLTLLDVQ